MKQSRKEFIKKAHKSACSEWKTKIENEFPKLFKEEALVVGKWYKHYSGGFNYLVCSVDNEIAYGFMDGKYYTELSFGSQRLKEGCIPATDKEVKQALIKEAIKKGFKEGVSVKCLNDGIVRVIREYCINTPCWEVDVKGGFNLGISTVMLNGKWAEIIKETITKEQAETELGKVIIN